MNRHPHSRCLPGLFALLLLAFWPALSANAANIALGKPCFASYNSPVIGNGTDMTANLTDGNNATAWTNAGTPNGVNDFVGVDLGAVVSFQYLRLNWPADHATAFNVEVANTVDTDPNSFDYGSGDWQTVYTRQTTDPQPRGANDYIDIGAQTYRYVRISVMASSNTSNAWGLNELQVLDEPLASLTGTITAGAVALDGALVSLSGPTDAGNPAPFVSTATVTNASGVYLITGLDAGTYTITASHPGKYAPQTVTGIVVGLTGVVTQNVALTTPVTNVTSRMPAYNMDFIAGPDNFIGQANANADSRALPADELPASDAVWDTSTPLPAGATVGPNLSKNLKIHFPPTINGKNNVVKAENAVIPFPNAHYTTIYVLQVAGEQPYYTTATLNYTDGSEVVTTSSGNALYGFSPGMLNNGQVGPFEDEIIAFTVDKLYNIANGGTEAINFNVYLRAIPVNKNRALSSLSFGGIESGPGSGTISKGYILGFCADTIDTPIPRGSISGTVTGPTGAPVKGAVVQYLTYSIVTDATGTYVFNGVPAGSATVTASKPANYAAKSTTITMTAGQNATVNFQFLAPIPVVTDPLPSPGWDVVSTDANYGDFTATGWMLGREYIPTGLFSPDVPGANTVSNDTYLVDPDAPSALPFDFGDIVDTAVLANPAGAGYPAGGTRNAAILQGAQFLAPPTQITNVYFVESGIEGSTNVEATLYYADGSTEKKVLAISDWFGSPSPDELPYLIMRGRHSRSGEANFSWTTGERGTIKLNALKLPVNPAKSLKYVSFWEAKNPRVYPSVLAVAWETVTQQPPSSDIQVVVKNADNTPAVGAIVNCEFYNTKTDANGVAVFRGIPAGLTVGVGAFIPGVTKQARVDGHVVPAGKKYNPDPGLNNADVINLTLNGGTPINVPLQLAYDFDMLSNPTMPGDYGCRASFANDYGMDEGAMTFPSNATTTYPGLGSLLFNTPHREIGYNNVLRANGQTAKVVPGHYSSMSLVNIGAGVGSDHPTLFFVTFQYADGTTEQIQYTTQDWVLNFTNQDAANVYLHFRTVWAGTDNPFYSPNRRRYDKAVQALGNAALAHVLPINAGKVLTGFTLVPMMRGGNDDDQEIFAITLEANDITGTSGTITGTITGQPIGASASGPIEAAMVSVDPFHGVYTDANGNFTLQNVPTGTATLKVIPYGTGILTKNTPITVVSGTNNLGTIDLGAGVTQVGVILGETNSEFGLRQIEGNITPYGYTVTDSPTTAVKLAGASARQTNTAGSYIYFDVDPGWLYRGKIGNAGLTVTDPGLSTQLIPKLAPDMYVQIEYLDRGTDAFNINFNMNEKTTNNGFDSIRLTNPYASGNGAIGTGTGNYVTKTNTNQWKTFTYYLNPAAGNNFGAYDGQNLQADFRISARNDGQREAIHAVILSITPTITPLPGPATGTDILKVYGGLKAGPLTTSSLWASYDLNGDGTIDLKDAVKAANP